MVEEAVSGQHVPSFATHFPVLAACVARSEGPVLECGIGHFSTPMLHYMCRNRRMLFSADSDAAWLTTFAEYGGPYHRFEHVVHWTDWPVPESMGWAVAFLDCAPGEARTGLAARLKNRARWIVLHDSEEDFGTGGSYGYSALPRLFRHVAEFRRFRPYTLVLSDLEPFDLEDFDKQWVPDEG